MWAPLVHVFSPPRAYDALSELHRERFLLINCFLFHLILQTSYYIVRPIRDAAVYSLGNEWIPFCQTASCELPRADAVSHALVVPTVVVSLALVLAMAHRDRARPHQFYCACAALLVAFAAWSALVGDSGQGYQLSFVIIISAINLLFTSLFWTTAVDVFCNHSARNCFPTLAAGGTIGTLIGPSLAFGSVQLVGNTALLLPIASGMLFVSAYFAFRATHCLRHRNDNDVPRATTNNDDDGDDGDDEGAHKERGRGGLSLRDSWRAVLHSPFLLAFSAFVWCMTMCSSTWYMMLNDLLQSRAMSKAESVAYFSQMDLMVNVLTIGSQFFGTKRLLNAVGFRATLLFVPLLSLFAFVAAPVLSNTDTLLLFVAGVHVARRAGNYAVVRPCREILWVSVPEDRPAKQFLDVIVYRLGDISASSIFAMLAAKQFTSTNLSLLCGAPMATLWIGTTIFLAKFEKENK